MKRALTLILAVAMLLSMAACGEQETTGPQISTTTHATESKSTDVPTTAPKPTEPKPTEHTHSYAETVKEPSCTEKGYTAYACACGDSYTDNETAALGHAWGEWLVILEPTEEAEGTAERTCSGCTEKETKQLAKLDHVHKYSEKLTMPTCTEKGYITYTCACGDSYTGNEVAAKGHAWGEWVTILGPTEEAEGKAERSCINCAEIEAKKLDMLVYTPPVAAVTKTENAAVSLYNTQGYAIVELNTDWPYSSYIMDKNGNVVFGPEEYWIYTLGYDSGIVLAEVENGLGNVRIPYYLDGTPMPLDEILPSTEMDAFFNLHEGNPAYASVEKKVYYQVESLYNGMMTLWRRCTAICHVDNKYTEYQVLVQSFVLSTDGTNCVQLPDIFNIESGAGTGGCTYIGGVGGYSDNGLMWFWHWDKLEDSIYNLEESSFNFQDFYEGDHFWPAGYMDMQGNIVIPAVYDTVWPFCDGLAAVKNQDGMLGFINEKGETVIPFVYSDAISFCDGYAAVQKDGKWGYIDENNNVVVPFIYDSAFGAGDGLMTVGLNGKYGILDSRGNIVVPFEFDDISTVENGVAYAIKDGFVYIITIH